MATLPNPKSVTYEEWLCMPEVTDRIEEVVDGEIRLMPPARYKHAFIVRQLSRALDRQLDPDRVIILNSSFGLLIRKAPLTSRTPDVAVFELASLVEKDGYVHSAPQLLIEVLSPRNTRKDMERKLADYAALGVPEVWVVSPEGCTVEVLYLEDGRLRRHAIVAEGSLQPRHFSSVQVPVAEIWPQ
jgi:Uma2 family endonuclease